MFFDNVSSVLTFSVFYEGTDNKKIIHYLIREHPPHNVI